MSGKQLFQTSNSLTLLICSFITITSLQIFWWNLTYNSQEDPFSPLFKKEKGIQKNFSERFIQAVNQLQNKDSVINRIAGVCELEKLVKDSDDYREAVINVLTQYIKNSIHIEEYQTSQEVLSDIKKYWKF